MDYRTYKKLNIKEGDIIGVKTKSSRSWHTDESFVLQVNKFEKEENPTKYWISGINHTSLRNERYRLNSIEEIKVIYSKDESAILETSNIESENSSIVNRELREVNTGPVPVEVPQPAPGIDLPYIDLYPHQINENVINSATRWSTEHEFI